MSSASSAREFIARSVAGDRAALERLLFTCFDRLAAHIASRFPSELQGLTGVDDILQRTCVKAFCKISSFRGDSEQVFYAWLRTIARRELADELKRRRNERVIGQQGCLGPGDGGLTENANLVNKVANGGSTPSRKVSRREAAQAIESALEALPEAYRRAIWLRYMQGLSLEEAAERMGRSVDSVRGLCDRAREKMRGLLGSASSYISR